MSHLVRQLASPGFGAARVDLSQQPASATFDFLRLVSPVACTQNVMCSIPPGQTPPPPPLYLKSIFPAGSAVVVRVSVKGLSFSILDVICNLTISAAWNPFPLIRRSLSKLPGSKYSIPATIKTCCGSASVVARTSFEVPDSPAILKATTLIVYSYPLNRFVKEAFVELGPTDTLPV